MQAVHEAAQGDDDDDAEDDDNNDDDVHKVYDTMFCAGYIGKGGKDACQAWDNLLPEKCPNLRNRKKSKILISLIILSFSEEC